MREASSSHTRYVPIDIASLRERLEEEMGFSPVSLAGTRELVYEREIPGRGVSVRVFSSVTPGNGMSRDCGEDAIRVVLHNLTTDRPVGVDFSRVYRTKNALDTMRDRCREAWGYAKEHRCLKCNGVTVERTVKATGKTFLGCSSYPQCK